MGDQAGRRYPPRRPRKLVFDRKRAWWQWTLLIVEVAIVAFALSWWLW